MSKCEGNFCRVRRKLGEMKSFSLNSRCACAFKSLQFIIESQCCKEHFYLSKTWVFGLVRVTFFEIIVVLWIDISWFSYHHLTCRQISSIHLKLLIRAINNIKNIYKKSHFPWNWLLSLHNWAKCTRTKKISRYIANIWALIENSNCNAAALPLELFIKAIKQLCEHVSGSKWVNIYFIKN